MAHWLFQERTFGLVLRDAGRGGEKGTEWSGIRNHSAKLNLMAMKAGETGFFYHSNEGKAIVGIVEVIKLYYPDPSDASGKFGMVDIKAVKASAPTGDAGGGEGGQAAGEDGAGGELATFGAAGDGRGMGAGL